jgi:hypothetical protein
VFSDGRPNQKRSIYAWQTLSSIADYVANEHRLPFLINRARAEAASAPSPGSYVTAAKELADVLFTGKGEGAKEGALAKAAFQELVEQSPTRPVIVVRVVSDIRGGQNPSIFVPLGIMAAKGDGAVLKQPITVMQPLPRERYKSQDSRLHRGSYCWRTMAAATFGSMMSRSASFGKTLRAIIRQAAWACLLPAP